MQDIGILKDYIAYARTYIQPKLSEEASQRLIQAYVGEATMLFFFYLDQIFTQRVVRFVEMRKVGSSRGAVSAYPRQLESLIRLAEAHAKMRLSSVVEKVDVEEARRYTAISVFVTVKEMSSGTFLKSIEMKLSYRPGNLLYQ